MPHGQVHCPDGQTNNNRLPINLIDLTSFSLVLRTILHSVRSSFVSRDKVGRVGTSASSDANHAHSLFLFQKKTMKTVSRLWSQREVITI